MIIKEIHTEGFGIFNGFSLTGLDKGVNILHGNNEVGKSTLLAFLRYTLFGYPDKRRKLNQYYPLNGGKHGGRIKAELYSGKEAIFERYAGTGNGNITLHYNGQELQDEDLWNQLLGNARENLYNNVYAFSLDELVNLESLSESGVKDKIFSVGMGLSNISIGEVEDKILKQNEEIYKPRGNKQLIPEIRTKIENKESRIKQIQQYLPQYQSLHQEITQLKKEADELESRIKESREEANTLHNYIKCYPYFITYTHSEQALKGLPPLKDYPEKGLERLEKLEEREETLSNTLRELHKGTKEERGIEELQKICGEISYNDKLAEKHDSLEYLRTNLEKYKQAVSEKEGEEEKIKKYNQHISKKISDINSQWTEEHISGFSDITVHKNAIENYKNTFNELTQQIRDQEAQLKAIQAKEGPLRPKAFAISLGIIFLIGAIPAFYYSVPILGGALLVIALILILGKKYFLKEAPANKLREKAEKLKAQKQSREQEYGQYLKHQLNLPDSLSPDAVVNIFGEIAQLQNWIQERNHLREKLNQQRTPFIRQFEETAGAVREISHKASKRENTEILVNQLISEYDETTHQLKQKQELEKELNRKRNAFNNSKDQLEQTQKEIGKILKSVSASDRDEFRRKYEQNNKVKEYLEQKKAAVEAIENIVGQGKAGQVIEYLNSYEKESIEARIRELEEQTEAKSQEWQDKNNKLGEKRNELNRIEGESELAAELTELETEKQKLQDAYKEWVAGQIASNLLNEVKSKYEREKQPQVIKNSSHYFTRITSGGYSKVRVPLDDKEMGDMVVYDAREAPKKIDQLSRGTKEQLLISLRLGFIEEYEKQAEPLPLVVDEVMVNFDPHRARQLAKILQEFGQNRQILLFTCHPSTQDHFDRSSVHVKKMLSTIQ